METTGEMEKNKSRNETLRRTERNKIRDEIRTIEKYIQTDLSTIGRFSDQNDTVFNKAQIVKLRAKNVEREEDLDRLGKRMVNLNHGDLDEELNDEMERVGEEVKRKTDETKNRKAVKKAEDAVGKEQSMAYYQSGREANYLYYRSKKDADKSYMHFIKACDSIPDYMKKKLKNMPNNKGYIWRSVYCYGDKLAERGNKPTVMFEKRNGVLIVHETTATEYKIWHKKGQERRTLFHHEMRKKKNCGGPSIMDYVKK
jgi:hypothetical protein